MATASAPSSTVRAKTDTQSMEAQAGTTPEVLMRPFVAFNPTMPFAAAGTRPDPAVSVPNARSTSPAATATALPELDPPDTSPSQRAFGQMPYGERVPTRPVAN